MNNNNLPQGSQYLLVQGNDGRCYPTGFARTPSGQNCRCGDFKNWTPQAPSAYGNQFALLSPGAYRQLVEQMAQGTSGVGSTFDRNDLPNLGAVGISRMEANASPAAGNEVYTLVLDNTLGATTARQFIGDYTGTYVLLGNTEATPAGFVIGGTWTTNSKTQFAGRTGFRPWRVSRIQFIASDETFFNLTQTFYFDTKPTSNGPTKDNLVLTSLLSASQYNPKIQWYDQSVRFDGINGLDITVPAGMKVTLQFSIVSEASAGAQVLLD
jgi:hypothetical protein